MDSRPFGIDETHGMLQQPGVIMSACSDSRNWTSLFASQQKEPPFQGSFKGTKDPFFLLVRDGKPTLKTLNGGKSKGRVAPGSILINSPGDSINVLHEPSDSTLETIHVYVRRSIIEEVALEMVDGDPARVQGLTHLVDSDPVLQSLMEASASAARDDAPGSQLFADFLSRAIASHWIRVHSGARLRPRNGEYGGGKNAKTLSEAIDYLKANMDQSISLEDIGEATNRSASYISRMFSAELGVPPHRYLMQLRVDKAKVLLEKTSMSISEIAYDCGFSHQEHLSRLFRRFTDTTPAAYRRSIVGSAHPQMLPTFPM